MGVESKKKPAAFLREATGLVREVGFWDAVVYNILPLSPGICLAYWLFWIPGTFPGGSIVWAMIVACVLAMFIASSFGILSMAMPRTSADYVAMSRIVHPGLALGSSVVLTFSSLLSAGYIAIAFTWWAVTPALSVIGATTGNFGLVQWAGTLSTAPWNFVVGMVGMIISCVVIAAGMRRLMIYQNILFVIGTIGLVVMAGILLATPQSVFIAQFNSFAQPFTKQADSYHYIIQEAAANGMEYPGTYNFAATIPVIPAIMASGMWTWWSVAFTGEVKGAATRRHWYSTLYAAVIQYAILIVMVLLIFNTIGEQFIASANYLYSVAPDKYAIPVAPMLPLLTGLVPGGILIPWFIVLTFITWTPLIHFIQLVQPVKALFAWSFDRLLPSKVADVSERTHSPLLAIAICGVMGTVFFVWAVWGPGFFELLILAGLCGAVVMFLMGITATVFPYVKRELYQASPAKIEVGGIPLCTIAGVITIIAMLFVAYIYVTDPRLGMTKPVEGLTLTFGLLIGGIIYYYIVRAFRARQGISLDYLFKEIPPE
jgi:amino acid transporter